MDGSVPTTQDFILLFVNAFYTTTTSILTAVIALIPTVIQAGINILFGLLQGGTTT